MNSFQQTSLSSLDGAKKAVNAANHVPGVCRASETNMTGVRSNSNGNSFDVRKLLFLNILRPRY